MLKHLTLKNFVLVEQLEIDFAAGLSTITGESGAGKSILLAALGLILGERANSDTIRPGADKADVVAEFDLNRQPKVQQMLIEAELFDTLGDDGAQGSDSALIRRVITNQGRSRAFVNGIPVTTTFLRQIGDLLVDIHGQNEHLQLSNKTTQLTLLDNFAQCNTQASKVRTLYLDWQGKHQTLEQLRAQLAQAADRRELLTYQLQELDEFALQAGEFVQLENEHKRLSQAHETLEVLQSAQTALDNLDSLRQDARKLSEIDDNHSLLASANANLQDALSLLDDAEKDLNRYQDNVIIDPQALQDTENRLNQAQDFARKHKVAVQELVNHVENLRDELQNIADNEDSSSHLATEVAAAKEAFLKAAKQLSVKRKKAAPKFAKQVAHYMQQLGIKDGDFEIEFAQDDKEATGETGIDRIEFLVTTNANFANGPINQIASGGEQTRIALSIQIVAAETSDLPCLILDEADVGVGGTTADTVGRILRTLAEHTQVICVTHAPQVAALGHHHYVVTKQKDQTGIHHLDSQDRVEELARMLAGADITEKTRDYAQTLLSAGNG